MIREAAALKYSPDSDAAPKIVAVGKGETAEKILEKARGNDIPVYEDTALAHTLSSFKLGDEIPEELYDIVAKILIFIGNVDDFYGNENG
jgi:flagellar biosynthesis protein